MKLMKLIPKYILLKKKGKNNICVRHSVLFFFFSSEYILIGNVFYYFRMSARENAVLFAPAEAHPSSILVGVEYIILAGVSMRFGMCSLCSWWHVLLACDFSSMYICMSARPNTRCAGCCTTFWEYCTVFLTIKRLQTYTPKYCSTWTSQRHPPVLL